MKIDEPQTNDLVINHPAESTGIEQLSHHAIIGVTRQAIVNGWNPAAEHLYGYAAIEIVGNSIEAIYPLERRAEEAQILARILHGEEVEPFLTDRVHKDGTLFHVQVAASSTMDGSGTIVGAATSSRSVNALQESRDRFEERTQLQRAEAQESRDRFEERVAEAHESRDRFEERVDEERLKAQESRDRFEERVDAERIAAQDAQDVFDAAERNDDDRREAEIEKASREAQLQQAQRLESLGQLAGGIAHDFNNLLAVILSYAAFVSEEMDAASQSDWEERWRTARDDVGEIQVAGERAASLTRQLLAFARREVVRPQVIDLNDVVAEVEAMLGRTLGEHIEVVTSLADDLWPVLADPGEMEQVLINLAVNARDAMPEGGTLTIDTSNVSVDVDAIAGGSPAPIGRSVRLRVSDTGTGMPAEIAEHGFEPFFTTKVNGAGTGLGLATAYGILSQADGQIQVYSEPGTGTTFNMTLPVTDQAAIPKVEPVPYQRTPKGERVLVVEDEKALREVTKRILARNGYEVLTAANGPEALSTAAGFDGEIHLLVTDVVMPQMLGKEVAAKLRATRPNLEVLYMSGYARPVLASQGKLAQGVALVEKPFSEAELLAMAGQVLNGHFDGFTNIPDVPK